MRVRRSLAGAAVALCAIAGVAACADTVNGSGSARPASSSGGGGTGGSGQPTGGSQSPTGFPSSASTGTGGSGPASYLITAPSGSEPGTSAWATTTSPTVTQFVQRFYDAKDVTDELARLQGEGITGVAHVLFIQNNVQVDVVLLQFSNAGGALIRHTGVVAATEKDPTFHSSRPAIGGDTTEFAGTTPDSEGNISSRAYAVKGTIALEVFELSPRTFDSATLTRYAGAQIAKLP